MTANSPDSLPGDELQESAGTESAKPKNDDVIPGKGDGVGVGAGKEPNTFEPEEAGEAAQSGEDEEGPQ